MVLPGLSYVDDGSGTAEITGARWATAPEQIRVLFVAFDDPPANRPDFWLPARQALDVWSAVPGLPLRFVMAPDGSTPDVVFQWVDRFPTAQAGITHRQLGEARIIDRVTVTLARTHTNGVEMSDEYLRMVALHEAGHVVGLPHSENPADVMHPGNRNFRLSERDLHSVRDLYRDAP